MQNAVSLLLFMMIFTNKEKGDFPMNAIEIRNLSKSFRGMYAVDHLDMTVPVGAMLGGAIFALGLGAVSKIVLNKTSLV